MTDQTLEQRSAYYRPYYKTAEDYPSLLLDETHALCSPEDFEAMLEYSASFPTGTYLGKVWKCSDVFYKHRDLSAPLKWQLAEYVPCDIPGEIGIKWRVLEVVA